MNVILTFLLDPRHVIVGLKLKGPDNSLRVRQIRILGEIEGESLKIEKQLNAQTIQQRNCETETLKVFRLITSQVQLITYIPRRNLYIYNYYKYLYNLLFVRYLANLYKVSNNNNKWTLRKELTKTWKTVMISASTWLEFYSVETI